MKVVWIYNFDGFSKEEFVVASLLVTRGTVTEKLMIKTSSSPANKKVEIQAAVAKLIKLPKGNKKLIIECF